jgi:GYF domain 2
MATERWFIARNKQKVGPFSAGDLKQLVRHGVLQPDEHVWLEGAGKWVEASSVPGLFRQAGEKSYWVALAGQTRGPFVAAQIRAGLNSHQFSLETQACADDVRQWMPLGQLPEFRDFKFETQPLTPSRAQLLVSALEFEEAALHLAGKSGDATAKLISTLLDMKRSCAANPGLVECLEATIAVLRARRDERETLLPEAPKPSTS